jgi:hypothetical protein
VTELLFRDHRLSRGWAPYARDPHRAGRPAADVAEIARAAAASERVVIHVHGGLVGTDRGMAIAARLTPEYQRAGAYPEFFVWSSGLLETITSGGRCWPAGTAPAAPGARPRPGRCAP